MKTATLTETKNNLSALVDQVRNGETVLILDRGRPVARLESVLEGDSPSEGRLARLEREGLMRRGTGRRPHRRRRASRDLRQKTNTAPIIGGVSDRNSELRCAFVATLQTLRYVPDFGVPGDGQPCRLHPSRVIIIATLLIFR